MRWNLKRDGVSIGSVECNSCSAEELFRLWFNGHLVAEEDVAVSQKAQKGSGSGLSSDSGA